MLSQVCSLEAIRVYLYEHYELHSNSEVIFEKVWLCSPVRKTENGSILDHNVLLLLLYRGMAQQYVSYT